jgi:hypothetical protein
MSSEPNRRLNQFYWIKGTEGWHPWQWTSKGWTNDYVASYYTDEEIGEIGPHIPAPDETPKPVGWRMRDDPNAEWQTAYHGGKIDEAWVKAVGFAFVEPLYVKSILTNDNG